MTGRGLAVGVLAAALAMPAAAQGGADPLAERRRAAPDVDGDIEHFAAQDLNELGLRLV